MNILYISKPYFVDSDLPLIKSYQEQGHNVTYIVIIAPYSLQSTIFNISRPPQKTCIYKVNEVDELLFLKKYINTDSVYIAYRNSVKDSGFNNLLFVKYIVQFINNIKTDVCHITFAPTFYETLLYKFHNKMIMTIHDPILHSGEKSLKRELFRRIAFKLVPKLIILNIKQKEEFCSKYNIEYNKVYNNQLGIYDIINLFKPDNLMNNNVINFNILFFGRISPYKGIDYLLDAFKIVEKEKTNVHLTIAGGGNLYFDYKPYENNSNITLINRYVTMTELYKLLYECDVVVCPYIDATQSGVIMTAFSMCKPVIATNVGNFAEVIHNGETGFIVEPRDVNSLAEKILMVANNDGLLSKMEENIRQEFYMGNSSWSNIAKRNIEIYTDN